jgi:hypothetical protein
MRWRCVVVVSVVAALCAACSPNGGESTATTPEDAPPDIGESAALVRQRAKQIRPVDEVLCHLFGDDLVLCAVTYVGPACQLWEVEAREAVEVLPAVEGISASRTAKGVACFP